MQRYFIENKYFHNSQIILTSNEVHHIKNVMRFKVNDQLIICNYSNQAFLTEITEFTKKTVVVSIIKELPITNNVMNLIIAQSLIRKDNFELVLQKTTELGVSGIIPLLAERTKIKITDFSKKKTRYEAIVKEASEQSERISLPKIYDLQKINDISYTDYDLVFAAYAREELAELTDYLPKIDINQKILVLIGPPGGFSQAELEFLNGKAIFISLGKTILRSETASIYLTSVFHYEWEKKR